MAAENKFPKYNIEVSDPATNIVNILAEKHDTNELTAVPRALYIGADGNIKVKTLDGATVTIPVFAGSILPLRIKQLFSTDTTSTSVWGLY